LIRRGALRTGTSPLLPLATKGERKQRKITSERFSVYLKVPMNEKKPLNRQKSKQKKGERKKDMSWRLEGLC